MSSKTQQALDWLAANPDRTPYAAAKQFNLAPSTLTRALKTREGREICPTCGQLLPNGKK